MHVTIHRGTHEVGGSCVEVNSGESSVVIDIGLPLEDKKGNRFSFRPYEKLSGPELVEKKILPDVRGFYEWDKSSPRVDALLVSHAHADHYGLWSYVRKDIPRYLGWATKQLIGQLGLFTRRQIPEASYVHFEAGKEFTVGDFSVVPFLMDHSAFDAYAFVIEAEGKRIIYTGDFRSGGRKTAALHRFLQGAPKKADALIIEGTNLGRVKGPTVTEKQLEKKIHDVFLNAPGVVFGLAPAQNIDRMVTFYKAARATKRTLILDLYMASVLDAVAAGGAGIPYPAECFPGVGVHFHPNLYKRMVTAGRKDLIYRFQPFKVTSEDIERSPNRYVVMVRPSLPGLIRKLQCTKGAQLVYSMWHGYLDEPGMRRFQELLEQKQISLVELHFGGHARPDILQTVVRKLCPKRVIPIHTANPESYKELLPQANVVVAEDGKTLTL